MNGCAFAHTYFHYSCLQCKLRFNLFGEISVQSGQYQLLPQSQMEASWGAWAWQTKAAWSPNIIKGLREAIKPSLLRLPLQQPVYKPIAFCLAHVIFLSSLVRQHDRWFSLRAACALFPVFNTRKTSWYIYEPLLIAIVGHNLRGKKVEEFLQESQQPLISDCNVSAWMWNKSVQDADEGITLRNKTGMDPICNRLLPGRNEINDFMKMMNSSDQWWQALSDMLQV